MSKRTITEAKKQRAIDALVALMECEDWPHRGTCWEFERACELIRNLPPARR